MNGILIPQNIFVGDTAQFLFLLSETESAQLRGRGFTCETPIPVKDIPQNEMMSIKEIRIVNRDNGQYLLITFIPWETGNIHFPLLSFLKLETSLPSIHVSSLLEDTERMSLQPPKPPLLLPGTDLLLYGMAITGIGGLILLGTGAGLLWRKLRRKQPRRTAKKRLGILRKKLKRLHKEARKIQKCVPLPDAAAAKTDTEQRAGAADAIRNWYASIDRSIREYIQALCTEDNPTAWENSGHYFLSATYTELEDTLSELFTPQRRIPDLFCIFYSMLERRRFGSTYSDLLYDYTAVSQDMLKKAFYIAEKTEHEYTALVHSRKKAALPFEDTAHQDDGSR